MTTTLRIALAGVLTLAASPAMAQSKLDCSKAFTTVDLNACAEQELERADARLNAVYKKALAKIAAENGAPPYDGKSWEKALRASQRAWIAFRDADCKELVAVAAGGGTATTGEVLGCLTEKTDARAKELADRFDPQ